MASNPIRPQQLWEAVADRPHFHDFEAGADSGIIDPIQNSIERVRGVDGNSRPFQLALDVLTGADRNCRAYIKAYRAGELDEPAVGAAS